MLNIESGIIQLLRTKIFYVLECKFHFIYLSWCNFRCRLIILITFRHISLINRPCRTWHSIYANTCESPVLVAGNFTELLNKFCLEIPLSLCIRIKFRSVIART